MKRILISILTIAIVVSAGVWGTRAYFSDVKQVTGNTFSTGTIDISVGTSLSEPVAIKDMKPGYTDYINFVVNNDGTNPVNVIKKVTISEDGDPAHLADVIDYDLNVELFDAKDAGGTMVWHQMLYDKNKTFAQIAGTGMFLGMVPKGWSLKVTQSYHMQEQAGDDYQNKKMSFDITVTGEQLKGIAELYPKSGDPKWLINYGGAHGTLTYGVKDVTFKGSFTATGLAAGTAYSLITYVDPWPGAAGTMLLGAGTSNGGGNLSLTIDKDTGNLTNMKVWLVLSSDFSGTQITGWHQASYLFETGLIDYYKAGL